MSNYPTLQQEFTAVIDNLKGREWIQGEEQRADGAVCAHGAVMTCQGLRPGDAHIIRAVMRAKGLTEGWNDQSGRTKDEVIAKLGLLVGVTDEDLAETFGPSWALVVAVIRRAAVLTEDESRSLAASRDAARAAARDAAAGLMCRDLIGQYAYNLLTGPWRRTIGPIHPDDAPMSDYLRGRIDKQERIRNVMAGER